MFRCEVTKLIGYLIRGSVYAGLVLAFCLTCPQAHAQDAKSYHSQQPSEWREEFIEVRLFSPDYGLMEKKDFFRIRMDHQDKPFVPLKPFFGQILGYKIHCDEAKQQCSIGSVPPRKHWVIGLKQALISGSAGKHQHTRTVRFKDLQVVFFQHQIWLKYNQIRRLMDIQVAWQSGSYCLDFYSKTPTYGVVKYFRQQKNKKLLSQQHETELKRRIEENEPVIEPDSRISGGVKYVLSHQRDFARKGYETNLNYAASIDLFHGNFLWVSGLSWPKSSGADASWTYALRKTKYFDLLELGYSHSDASLLSGVVGLKNSIKFNLYRENHSNLLFYYQGQAMPGTEINVWRGSILIETIEVGKSGLYKIRYPSAEPGDVFKIVYYYPDGTESEKSINYSPDDGDLLGKGHWSFDTSSGELVDKGGFFSHSLWRYGLMRGLVTGVGVYYIALTQLGKKEPWNTYFNLGWQPLSYLHVSLDYLLSKGYAAKLLFTYFKKHRLNLEYRYLMAGNNPLLVLFAGHDNNNVCRWSIRDNYNITGSWRLVTYFKKSNLMQSVAMNLSGTVFRHYSTSLRGDYERSETTSKLSLGWMNSIIPAKGHLLQLNVKWHPGVSHQEILDYSYRSQSSENRFNGYQIHGKLMYQRPGDPAWNVSGSFSLNMGHHWKAALNVGAHTFSLQVSFLNVWDFLVPKQLPEEFNSGSVSGYLLAPQEPGKPQKPLSHVKVQAAGKKVETDEKGFFVINGLPAYEKSYLSIDLETLDFKYIPLQERTALLARPNTEIHYDPKLVYTVGFDGHVVSRHELSRDIFVLAVPVSSSGASTYKAPVDPEDGFFVFEKIPPGRYELRLLGIKNPPIPTTITLTLDKNWVSDIEVKW